MEGVKKIKKEEFQTIIDSKFGDVCYGLRHSLFKARLQINRIHFEDNEVEFDLVCRLKKKEGN